MPNQNHTLVSVPDDIESNGAKLVYLAVSVADEPTTAELTHMLQMNSLALYPILRTLAERGHVDTEGETITCT
ncbi:TrmB family transcriptional regulator [Haloferax sp. MBLA0077]|uniref:TrmB family transcriptional regulator n=2 Tax=Haloferax TaxID=2251 RepID=A0A6G1Z333_9EURY|nr:TrmB family transcriptional regulator [Haloferax sp. CBA1149]MRW80821.1 TrmB family transcriptional regulator [Haloferax marinisediminis]